MGIIQDLTEKYYRLAKLYGTTAERKECLIGVPANDFDLIVSHLPNAKYYIEKGEYEHKGEPYFETKPNCPGQFYNPDIVIFLREI